MKKISNYNIYGLNKIQHNQNNFKSKTYCYSANDFISKSNQQNEKKLEKQRMESAKEDNQYQKVLKRY